MIQGFVDQIVKRAAPLAAIRTPRLFRLPAFFQNECLA